MDPTESKRQNIPTQKRTKDKNSNLHSGRKRYRRHFGPRGPNPNPSKATTSTNVQGAINSKKGVGFVGQKPT